jgi:hypothetical protein
MRAVKTTESFLRAVLTAMMMMMRMRMTGTMKADRVTMKMRRIMTLDLLMGKTVTTTTWMIITIACRQAVFHLIYHIMFLVEPTKRLISSAPFVD